MIDKSAVLIRFNTVRRRLEKQDEAIGTMVLIRYDASLSE